MYTTFLSKYFPWAVTQFCKAFASISGNHFSIPLPALVASAVASPALANLCAFETLYSKMGTGESFAVGPGNIADIPNPSHFLNLPQNTVQVEL